MQSPTGANAHPDRPAAAQDPTAPSPPLVTVEGSRLHQGEPGAGPWRAWGPYLSERAWGTVREDYSADGDAWAYFPFEHAASRAYRWSEDGMGGICDLSQQLCLALSLWNGQDSILKERPFGLTGPQGNHGEDVKDYWWYLDAVPSSAWLRWRYHYPQAAFPYQDLIDTNRARDRNQPEYELIDTGVFNQDRYWVVTATWAKASPEDFCWQIDVTNAGQEAATLDILPTVWFRNTWSWDSSATRPGLSWDQGAIRAEHPDLGVWYLTAEAEGRPLFCENETNVRKLFDPSDRKCLYPKDGIADHVISGAPTVNPEQTGTKASVHHHLQLAGGQSTRVRLRFSRQAGAELADGFSQVMRLREAEADEFHASLLAPATTPDEAMVARQAAAGMLWSKQFFHYNVERWLAGDPAQPAPPPQRGSGRNAEWVHLNNLDVISMPDPWEYPWYASWDLAFHCVALAHLDPEFAKRQLVLLGREWYMHPNGQLPAYEWDFSDVNPPVQAWAALRVAHIDAEHRRARGEAGELDISFIERVFHKLLLNFTWWINRKDAQGNNVFQGGFLGLDNIGLFDRSNPPQIDGSLLQSDGTAWVAMFCLNMLEMALILSRDDGVYEDLATKFLEHFTYIADAIHSQGLWDQEDGWFYDVVAMADGSRQPIKVVTALGMISMFATAVVESSDLDRFPTFKRRLEWFLANKPRYGKYVEGLEEPGHQARRLASIVSPGDLSRILSRVLDPAQLLSDHGLRSLSAELRDRPFTETFGSQSFSIDYEPAESTTFLFGGNSNWRGPVWFPINYLVIGSLHRFASYLGPDFAVSGADGKSLPEVADDLSARLVSLFLRDQDGKRPIFGGTARFQEDPRWRDQLWFNEYFHGDNGAGLGASHQTGWTGLVLDLIAARKFQEPR